MEDLPGRGIWRNRWLVLVASMWLQTCGGVGYIYGSYSPVIKARLLYNQKQMNTLAVAKDIGAFVGIFAGSLSAVLPPWGLVLLGGVQNLVGYGGIWMLVTNLALPSPIWLMCVLIMIGTNEESYFNTVSLVSAVRNFPRNRGPVVGILKGFNGLCGAIFTLAYGALLAPHQEAFILLVAVAPIIVGVIVMPIIRPLQSSGIPQDTKEESEHMRFIYNLCLVIAAYLLVVLLVKDILDVSKLVTAIFYLGMLLLFALPLVIPLKLEFFRGGVGFEGNGKMVEPLMQQAAGSNQSLDDGSKLAGYDSYFSELEDEERASKSLPEPLFKKEMSKMRSELYKAVAEGAVKVKRRRKGPRRGEDFTLIQALRKADFLLMFGILFCGCGSGLTAIDNLGQMGQAQGYSNAHMFVSMISIWNFLGRVSGGFVSEWIRICLSKAQLLMAFGHLFYAMAWPLSLYVGSLLVGLSYGMHWAAFPSAVSELFGLKNFGSFYNFLTVSIPLGTILFSGVLAGSVYDNEAAKQLHGRPEDFEDGLLCEGAVCFRLTFLILMGVCIFGFGLCMLLVKRTVPVYAGLYGKQQEQEQGSHASKAENGGNMETIIEEA
ncbi:protein NUCLEAR FUSION DEFECTIVE 4-like [Selaginella moellendorffii]|uniref:protein NUCLEAR FUSION DEFECTIVE 4-like n=1 Tax=Selaginella moellendorffii TaxID=88036 RepID=UPI000D1CE091|nr:protein NUCLEAR FUSION DEFECTIVE 4-like [Selaginella moellendorffii]|eukprot:XP_024524763.1 protein NUCLEAR FUSION DEFECTIVE 4-like [Selaginella moellendorffii]